MANRTTWARLGGERKSLVSTFGQVLGANGSKGEDHRHDTIILLRTTSTDTKTRFLLYTHTQAYYVGMTGGKSNNIIVEYPADSPSVSVHPLPFQMYILCVYESLVILVPDTN